MLFPLLSSFMDIIALLSPISALGLVFAVTTLLLLRKITTSLHRKLCIARGLSPLPGPPGVWLLGNMPAYMKNRDRIYHFLEELLKQYGGRMKMPWHLFFDGAIYITDPKDVQHILSTNVNNYVKPQGFLDAFNEMFENSFFAVNHHPQAPDGGAGWRLQRKVAAKVFTTANFRVFTEQVFANHAAETLAAAQAEATGVAVLGRVSPATQRSFCCDMQDVSARYTLNSIFDVAFGLPLSDVADAREFAQHMDFVNKHCAQRLFVKQYYKLLRWFMPSERALRRSTNKIHAVADDILLRRLQEPEEIIKTRSDLLSLFIHKTQELACDDGKAQNNTLEGVDATSLLGPKTLRSIILTFVFAGRDTTAECLTYSFYTIATHPKVQQRIVEELETAKPMGSTDEPFTFEEVKRLKYLEAVVYETVRLYPALPFNVKNAVNDDYLPDGTFVPAGVDIVYSPWYMGRNGAIWGNDPMEFRPERWLEMSKRPSAYEFPAFQAGPRICLGMNMAVLEAKLFLATTLRRFHVEIPIGEKRERSYVLKSGLFMDGGLPLQLTPRLQPAVPA